MPDSDSVTPTSTLADSAPSAPADTTPLPRAERAMRRFVARSLAFFALICVLAACNSSTDPDPEPTDDPPATPTGLTAEVQGETVTLDWTASTEDDLSHYNVYQGTESGSLSEIDEVPAGTETYEATGLEPGTTYYFAIDAEDGAGNRSGRTSEVDAEIAAPPDDPPASPAGLFIETQSQSATLDWAANTEDDLSHYNVYQGTESGSLSEVAEVPAGTQTYEVTGLEPETTYYFAIDAEDEAGNRSEPTSEVEAQTAALLYEVHGGVLSGYGGNVYVYLDGEPVPDATVTVNDEDFAHQGGAAYRKYPLDQPVDLGEALELEVTIGDVVITATGTVPERPVITGPPDGSNYAPDGAIPVTWTSAADPDYFNVLGSYTTDTGGSTSRGEYNVSGNERAQELDAEEFPSDGRDIEIRISAFNEGDFVGPATDGSTMGIRTESPVSGRPVVTVSN